MNNPRLLFDFLGQKNLVINYVDVGARGDVGIPWSLFPPERINVIGFEPDPKECSTLQRNFPNRKYFPFAVWSKDEKRRLNLCEIESTSSMYPPNESSNHQYMEKHCKGRSVVKEVEVPCKSLDLLLKNVAPDFIKIDTQGAELEVLKGSQAILQQFAPLVLAETWCAEIYAGAPFSHDIMGFMHDLGYQVFDLSVAAAWKHRNPNGATIVSKGKTIGFDILFVKQATQIGSLAAEQLLKLVLLCDLYGFRDYGLYLLDQSSTLESETVRQLKKTLDLRNKHERRWINRVKSQILSRTLRKSPYPPLH